MGSVGKLSATWTGWVALAGAALANNIQVGNLSMTGSEPEYTQIEFDVSWNNSWRASWAEGSTIVTNWDAAWIFAKCRAPGGNWVHATLSTNSSHHTAPTGAELTLGLTDDKSKCVGVFLHRSAEGGGAWSNRIALRWNYKADGMPANQSFDISVHALEMVYMEKGAFYVGSGGSELGRLYEGGGGNSPFLITNAGPIECANASGKLWGASQTGNNSMGGVGTIPDDYPNGYRAFYCMKYEVTQGQYADFLNMLTRDQQAVRCTATTLNYYMSGTAGGNSTIQNRNAICLTADPGGTSPRVFTSTRHDRACNWISWADVAAYADWAGLRPMTELEFEKACRGPMAPVANEYAWGTARIMASTKVLSGAEDGSETVTTDVSNGAAHYGNVTVSGGDAGSGPLRAGIFATDSSTRVTAGASYWGVMELSGNLWERTVTIGNATGRLFTGLHGDGALTSGGDADVAYWPGTGAAGAGFRGGNWSISTTTHLSVSGRNSAASIGVGRDPAAGVRAVRTAP